MGAVAALACAASDGGKAGGSGAAGSTSGGASGAGGAAGTGGAAGAGGGGEAGSGRAGGSSGSSGAGAGQGDASSDANDGGALDAPAGDSGDAADGGNPEPTLGCPAGSGAGPLGGSRPAPLKVPAGYTPTKKYPLVLELAGRGGTGTDAENAFKMAAMADANQLFVIAPTGTYDSPPPPTAPATFWNATDACCNMYGSKVDDVVYLRSLICHTKSNYSIDPNKVFIIGGSNGAFMAHRMACDAADLVTAIIAISGLTWNDPSKCKPTHPVSVLQIHGTLDDIVPFGGTPKLFWGPAPSATQTYQTWASLNGCTGPDVAGPTVDFDKNIAGAETTTQFKAIDGTCKVATQLFVVNKGTHVFNISSSTKQFFIDWFKATPPNHP